MKNAELIMRMAKENNGVITSAKVTESGLSRGTLKYLTDIGKLERSARGVYILPEVWDDEIYNLQVQFKRGIFSGETALFLNDLTDRTPILHRYYREHIRRQLYGINPINGNRHVRSDINPLRGN